LWADDFEEDAEKSISTDIDLLMNLFCEEETTIWSLMSLDTSLLTLLDKEATAGNM
jgi:hypothetical protein